MTPSGQDKSNFPLYRVWYESFINAVWTETQKWLCCLQRRLPGQSHWKSTTNSPAPGLECSDVPSAKTLVLVFSHSSCGFQKSEDAKDHYVLCVWTGVGNNIVAGLYIKSKKTQHFHLLWDTLYFSAVWSLTRKMNEVLIESNNNLVQTEASPFVWWNIEKAVETFRRSVICADWGSKVIILRWVFVLCVHVIVWHTRLLLMQANYKPRSFNHGELRKCYRLVHLFHQKGNNVGSVSSTCDTRWDSPSLQSTSHWLLKATISWYSMVTIVL